MTTIEQLSNSFSEYFNGTPWYGDNYTKIISDITPEEALSVPGNQHSIAVLLWHMVKWRKALAERLLGNLDFRADVGDSDNWRDVSSIDHASWEEAKKQYEALQSVIVSELRKRNDVFLDEEFLPGKTYRWLTVGVIQHDIYHLGQIAFLKSLLRQK
jgi:uncharacterized damage-inducible protein DinB